LKKDAMLEKQMILLQTDDRVGAWIQGEEEFLQQSDNPECSFLMSVPFLI